jgi:hypothetical protein
MRHPCASSDEAMLESEAAYGENSGCRGEDKSAAPQIVAQAAIAGLNSRSDVLPNWPISMPVGTKFIPFRRRVDDR